jgi:SAM-dependent methyltransferase
MHANSLLLFNRYARPLFRSGLKVLEVGPADVPAFKESVADASITWETIDIYESPALTYSTTDPYRFRIADESHDIVLAANVIEHVPAIWRWIKEVTRVCRRGGHVVLINPVNWGFHEYPVDCWRIYPDGMKALFEDAGLQMEFSKAEHVETVVDRLNWHGIKWLIKPLLGRPRCGEPFLPVDTISIGRRIG